MKGQRERKGGEKVVDEGIESGAGEVRHVSGTGGMVTSSGGWRDGDKQGWRVEKLEFGE